jgi:AraC-like DNA-binding protein
MSETHLDLRETTIDGPDTRLWALTREECPALAVHRIKSVGLTDAAEPFRRVRLNPGGSFVMVCHQGVGAILLDGRWRKSRPGVACLAPPRVLNAFHAVEHVHWRFAWIRYEEPGSVRPVVSASSPVRVRCDSHALWRTIAGLRAELKIGNDPKLIHHWIELAHGEARRIAQPWHVSDRLWTVWADVRRDLAAEWSLDQLATLYGASKEQFRRVCLAQLGRSPMHHLASLRIEQACQLLSSGAETVETIARQVGFENPAVFSRAFKRWVGRSPSAYRG